MQPILFLDCDGTIRETISGQTFINDPEDQKLIQGVTDIIKLYPDHIKIGITNQGGVAAGKKSVSDAIKEQQITLKLLPELSSIYFCPDFQGLECYLVDRFCVVAVHEQWKKYIGLKGTYRKPNPGMVELAIARFSSGYDYSVTVDRSKCLFVGDRPEDRECAVYSGIPFLLASDWLKQAA